MGCYCYLRNNQDLLSDGKTPYERRFGMPFNGPVIPCGAMVEISPYFCERPVATAPIRSKSLARKIPWICVARVGNLERRQLWSQTSKNWRRWTHPNSTLRRLNAKEVLTPQRSGNFIFPVADGTVKILGGEQRLRTSTLIRERPEWGARKVRRTLFSNSTSRWLYTGWCGS